MKSPPPLVSIFVVLSALGVLLTAALLCVLRLPPTGPPLHWVSFGVTVLLTLCFLFIFIAPWRWGLPIIIQFSEAENAVALTFDDGPSPDITPRILEILAAHGAQATFFILGMQARRHPELVRRIAAEGHFIACHGDRHEAMVLRSTASIIADIEAARGAIAAAHPEGAAPRLLRPPYGFKSPMLLIAVRRLGMRLVTWNADPADYLRRSSRGIASAALAGARPGAIILLHDGPGRTATAEALPVILTELRERGLSCVSLAALDKRG